MDEAGSKTQTQTPPTDRETEPDATIADTVAEHAVTSSPRTRYGNSYSGSTGADSDTGVSAALDGSGRDAGERSGTESAAGSGTEVSPAGATGSDAEHGAESGAAPQARTPSFTPSFKPSPEPAPAGNSTSIRWDGSYSDSSSSTGTAESPTVIPSYSPPDYTAPAAGWSPSESAWSASSDSSARQETAATAPVFAPAQDTASAGAPSAGGRFSVAATAAVSGAASGLAGYANSVTSAWQGRGANSKRKAKGMARQPAKRQAALTLTRLEPWSVMKFSFMASVVAFIILFVAVAVLYMTLSALGVFESVQHTVSTITSSKSSIGTNISHWFSASLILGYTAMLGALNIVLITALATIGSVIYNLIAKTVGGIEVTLEETE